MVFKICDGISCSSSYVKEFDVIVHKKYFPRITKCLAILYPKSRANLVVDVVTRHSHHILSLTLLSADYALLKVMKCRNDNDTLFKVYMVSI